MTRGTPNRDSIVLTAQLHAQQYAAASEAPLTSAVISSAIVNVRATNPLHRADSSADATSACVRLAHVAVMADDRAASASS